MNPATWHSQPPQRRKWLRRAAWALVAYAVIGFLVLPPIIRAVAVKQLSKELGREVSIQKLRINPFMLSTTIRGLLIKDRDGQPFISWDEVYVNFQLSSLLRRAWVFREVNVVKPFARVQVNKDYSLNFSDVLAKVQTNWPGVLAKPPALRIGRLHLQGATASCTDLTPRTPFIRTFGPLEITLAGFRTDPDNKNPYAFAGTTDAGEKFTWSGHFFLGPIRSQGEFVLENMRLNKYAPLYQDLIRFVIKDGSMDLRAAYDFQLSATNCVASVTNASFALHSFKLAEPGSEANIVELPEFAVAGVSADAMTRRVEVDSISGTGGKLFVQRNQDAEINVIELSIPAAGATNVPGGILLLMRSLTNTIAMFLNSTNNATGIIRNMDLRDCALTLEDLVNSRPVRLELDQIALSARNISNERGTNLTAALSLRWNTNGTVKVDVEGSFMPPTADLQLAFDKLELRPLDPYLESMLNLFILDSKLSLNGKVRYRTTSSELPDVTFQGDEQLDDFSTVDGTLGEELLKWRSLRVSGIEANLSPPTVAVKEVALDDASAHVVVETNGAVNLLAALRMETTNVIAGLAAKPAKGGRANKSPGVALEPSTPGTNKLSAFGFPKISIATIVVTNAQLRLTDRSLIPTVNLTVEQLGGTIAGLSTEELQHADVNLHALVDNTGPVEITGTINPFSKGMTTDLKMAMKNVDLTPGSPYSGKYAGYRIAKGKLDYDLACKISERKLAAQNLILLDQFTFGEKVNSPDATKLPVKLGVAVLKDRNGKIEMDVPVEGSLDDPEFRLGKVIGQAILNVFTKVMTSPFSVLGSVFGGKGEELSFQEFIPGSAALESGGKAKLDALAKGLYERPALQLEIEGSVDPDADREGLRRVRLDRQLRYKKWTSLRSSERATVAPEQVTLTPEEGATWVASLYNVALAKGEVGLTLPKTNQSANAAGSTVTPESGRPAEATKGATALLSPSQLGGKGSSSGFVGNQAAPGETSPRPARDVNEMAEALRAAIVITDGDLEALASQRAKAVREYILQTGQAESERIFLTENQPGGLKATGSRAYLQLR